MKKIFLIFCFIQIVFFAFADSGPKFSQSAFLSFYKSGKLVKNLDSICVIVNQYDTAILHYNSGAYHEGVILNKVERGYQIFTFGRINSFSIIVFIDGKKLQSPSINHYYGNSVYKID